MPRPKTKTCIWCKAKLNVKEYHKSSDRADGLQELCKTCNKYRTMYASYGRKDQEWRSGEVKAMKIRALLLELKADGIKPREAVVIATNMSRQE